jgi:ribonuclease HI
MTRKKMRRDVFDAFTAGFNAAREIHGDSTYVKEQFEAAWKLFVAANATIKEPAKGWPEWMTKRSESDGGS